MIINKPKFIAIDTSILSEWAKDTYSNDVGRRNIASKTLDQILSNNWVPVITWYHFEELLKYSDESAVENRMRFILNLPHVAWLWRANGLKHIGSVVDVLAAEIKTYLSAECDAKIEDLLLATRAYLLRFGVPSDIPTLKMWRELRQDMVTLGLGKRQQEIASILHAYPDVDDNRPLSALIDKRPLSSEDQKQAYDNKASALKHELVKRGDKRILDHAEVAGEFCNGLFSNVDEISKSKLNMYEAFLKQFGYSSSELPKNITVGEFRVMAVRRRHLEAAAKHLGVKIESIWPKLKEHLFPSEEIISELRESRKTTPRASGSDLNDDYLASLMPYLDAVIVDKRTYEYLKQAITRNPCISGLTTSAFKVESYRSLPDMLIKEEP